MATIAAPTLAAVDAIDGLNDRLMDQEMATHTAEGNYQEAKLSREIAEIEIIEYKLGIAVQELAVAEGELKLAQSELERAKANTAESKVRLGRISRYCDESPSGLNLVYLYTDHLKADELRELKAKYVIEQAESKKKVLVEYTHPKRLKELQADIEKKRSVELEYAGGLGPPEVASSEAAASRQGRQANRRREAGPHHARSGHPSGEYGLGRPGSIGERRENRPSSPEGNPRSDNSTPECG